MILKDTTSRTLIFCISLLQIVELDVVTKGVNKNGQPRKFLKGVVGDESGLIRFDLAEKDGVQFTVGNIVQFEKAMNKVSNQGHHYVEVKRYGTYTILSSVLLIGFCYFLLAFQRF